MSRRRITLLLSALATMALSVGVAHATTGSTIGFPQPKVYVPFEQGSAFEGRYVVSGIGRGAGVRSAEMKIEFEEDSSPAFLVGISEFYLYNSVGQTEIGLFSLYPFKPLPNGKGVTVDILKQGLGGYGQLTPAGELTLFTPHSEETIKGELKLHGGGPYPIVLKRLADDQTTHGNPPAAKQLAENAKPSNPNWGAEPSEYEGEYELTNPAPDPTKGAGTLAAVISVAQGLGVKGTTVTGGSMKVAGNPATADVTVETGAESQSFTLTDLAWEGDLRVATAHRGDASGPVVGRFEGTASQDVIKGTLDSGHSIYQLSFQRQG